MPNDPSREYVTAEKLDKAGGKVDAKKADPSSAMQSVFPPAGFLGALGYNPYSYGQGHSGFPMHSSMYNGGVSSTTSTPQSQESHLSGSPIPGVAVGMIASSTIFI
jgi:hypothetical protein